MSRLYVSLKLKNGDRILTYGNSNAKDINEYYNRLLDLIRNDESPSGNYRIGELDGAILKLCTRKSKKIRRYNIFTTKQFIVPSIKYSCDCYKDKKLEMCGSFEACKYCVYSKNSGIFVFINKGGNK